MKKSKNLLSALLLVGALAASAAPAYRGTVQLKQPDGSVITVYLRGDEHRHQRLTADGYAIMQSSDGYYRYAYQTQEGYLSTEGAPIVRDIPLRSAADKAFLKLIKKAENFTSSTETILPMQAKPIDTVTPYEKMRVGSFPTTGDFKGVVILAQFQDQKFTYDASYFERMLNEEGFHDNGAIGSAHDYFYFQSNGRFNPHFDVVGPVTLSKEMSYYGKDATDIWGNMIGDEEPTKAIAEACQLADPLVDFKQYDLDGDGKVEMVYVIYAGYGENFGADANTIWPHKYELSSAGYNVCLDDVCLDTYACSAELFGNSGTTPCGIGPLTHEFGHVLGLADHYNTATTEYELGRYDNMDYGTYNENTNIPPSYTAFERISLGWMEPTIINEPSDVLTLENIADSRQTYLLPTARHDEFYLLENRQQTGWDVGIKASGLMITHVDFLQNAWDKNTLNNTTAHRRYYLVCADNESGYDETLGHESEAGDLFPFGGNDAFTDETTPASQTYQGVGLDRWVTDIRHHDGVVSFRFRPNHFRTPSGLGFTEVRDDSFRAYWEGSASEALYDLRWHSLARESDLPVALAEVFVFMNDGTPSSPDSKDISVSLDNYMERSGWTGKRVYQAGGAVKLGAVDADGTLTTPKLNLYNMGEQFTVLVRTHSLSGKTPVFTVSSNGKTGAYRLTSSDKSYYYQFDNGLTVTDVTFQVKGDVAIIDSILIVRGNGAGYVEGALKVNVTGEAISDENPEVEEQFVELDTTEMRGINGESVVINGLQKDNYYSFEVRATNADGSKTSQWSVPQTVLASEATKVDRTDCHTQKGTAYYSLDGVRIDKPTKAGVYIRREGTQVMKLLVR